MFVCYMFASVYLQAASQIRSRSAQLSSQSFNMPIRVPKEYPYSYVPETKADLDWAERQ